MKVNDFFCGAGGFGLGFLQAGFEIVGTWDIDDYAIKQYAQFVDKKVQKKDIQTMTYADVPYTDVWSFGFPCQDISIAKQDGKGIFGQRSGLFFEVMRLLKEIKIHSPHQLPKIIVAENVKNVQRWLDVIEEQYDAHGYRLYAHLYDSVDFGLAQNRERYFLIGVRKDIPFDFQFKEPHKREQVGLRHILEHNVDTKYYMNKPYQLFAQPKGKVIGMVEMKGQDNIRRIYDLNCPGPTLTTSQGGHRQPKIIDEKGLRKLTPREYARMQGFPDTYKQIISDSQFYKIMGNAVSVPVAFHVANMIKEFISSIHNTAESTS